MPFKSVKDVPEHVPADKREQWLAVFNDTFNSCEDSDTSKCEQRAFQFANGAVKEQQTNTPNGKHEVRTVMVSEFRGWVPEIPNAPTVDIEAMLGNDTDPMFVSLPIAQLDAVSGNGLVHDNDFIDLVLEQLSTGNVTGIAGHISDDERDTVYPMPDVYWVGAAPIGEYVWAKGFIPPGASRVREHVRLAKATKGKIATSFYGMAIREPNKDNPAHWHAREFKLEQLDLAPYDRAALPLGDVWHVTAEMTQTANASGNYPPKDHNTNNGEQTMGELNRNDVINALKASELTDALRAQVIAEYKQKEEYTQALEAVERVAELEGEHEKLTIRVSELEETNMALEEANEKLTGRVKEFETTERDHKLNTLIAEHVKIEELHGMVKEIVLARTNGENTYDTVLAEYLETDTYKKVAESMVAALGGPHAFTNRGNSGNSEFTPSEDEQREALNARGWTV